MKSIISHLLLASLLVSNPSPAGGDKPSSYLKMDEQIEYSISMLTEQKGMQEQDIEVVKSESVTWPSGAMGCPEPGKDYTQALMPGVLIILRANDELYHFHAGLGGAPIMCPAIRAQAPIGNNASM